MRRIGPAEVRRNARTQTLELIGSDATLTVKNQGVIGPFGKIVVRMAILPIRFQEASVSADINVVTLVYSYSIFHLSAVNDPLNSGSRPRRCIVAAAVPGSQSPATSS